MLRPQFEAMRARLITLRTSRTVLRLLSALFAVVAIACSHSQGDGETCQSNRDCEDGLICLPPIAERSVCGRPEDVDLADGGDDAGDPDLPPDDAGRGDAGDEPSDQDAGDEPSDMDAG
jgi:hypothetical protein